MPKKQKQEYSLTRARRKSQSSPATAAKTPPQKTSILKNKLFILLLAAGLALVMAGTVLIPIGVIESRRNLIAEITFAVQNDSETKEVKVRFILLENESPLAVSSFVYLANNNYYSSNKNYEGSVAHSINNNIFKIGEFANRSYTNGNRIQQKMTADKFKYEVKMETTANTTYAETGYTLSSIRSSSASGGRWGLPQTSPDNSSGHSFRIAKDKNAISGTENGTIFGIAVDEEQNRANINYLVGLSAITASPFRPTDNIWIKNIKITPNGLKWSNYNIYRDKKLNLNDKNTDANQWFDLKKP